MTFKDEIINEVHGLLFRAFTKLGIKDIELMEFDGISFPYKEWYIELKITAKKRHAKNAN